jgi:hypothetical protein
MKRNYNRCKRICSVLLLSGLIVTKVFGNNNSDSIVIKSTNTKRPSLVFTAGYRIPLNKNIIISSGHGIYIEGGINAGRLISKKLLLGIYGGYALQDRFWSTSFRENFASDYKASINKEQPFSTFDSSLIYSSADLFKNAKGSDATVPGCASKSFHNYSLYYGLIFRLPHKYMPILKIYMGTTRSHYQGDGNIVTRQKEFNIFELTRSMFGCELGLSGSMIGSSHSQNKFSRIKNMLGLSLYYESCNFYNSSLYFDDGSVTKKIPLRSFTSAPFLNKYKNEIACGIKLFLCINS